MLTVLGNKQSTCCDGLSRRNFLRAGFLGLGGLTLGDVFRLQARAESGRRLARKSRFFRHG